MAPRALLRDAGAFFRDIRLEHSVFALPFALLGMVMATAQQVDRGLRPGPAPTVHELGWILVAMVGTRSAAMGFNRIVDRRLDARNPRTSRRPLAAGVAGLPGYAVMVAAGAALLLLAAWRLNPLSLALAPLVLLVVLGYSYTKRFTAWCHFVLGLALGLAPTAAWVAICGTLPDHPGPYLLTLAVILWVGGFDIIYATMDVAFDREEGLHSLPARLGVPAALTVARTCHAAMVFALVGVALATPQLGPGFLAGVAMTGVLLAYEHAIVRPDDLRRVNTAFFTLNGVVGLLLLAAGLLDLLR